MEIFRVCEYEEEVQMLTMRIHTEFAKRTFFHFYNFRRFCNLLLYSAPLKLIKKQLQLASNLTLVDCASFCRDVLFDNVVETKSMIGGPGKIFKIDESLFEKRIHPAIALMTNRCSEE